MASTRAAKLSVGALNFIARLIKNEGILARDKLAILYLLSVSPLAKVHGPKGST